MDKENSIFVVGGGPSLKGFDFNQIKDLNTIVINSSIQDVPNANYFITCDPGIAIKMPMNNFYNSKAKKILAIHYQHPRLEKIKPYFNKYDEIILAKETGGNLGFTTDTFAQGGNSGFCAFQYSVLLNFKYIYLLGIDLNIDNGLHYHNRSCIMKKDLQNWFDCFKKGLEILKEKSNITVISCSSSSRLNGIIDYIKFEDL